MGSPQQLIQTKGALSFAVNSCVVYLNPDGSEDKADKDGERKGVPTMVTQLAVGCKRKFVIYSWKDGEPQPVKVSRPPELFIRDLLTNNL
jgi:Vam6/Vps39-like protein vacuolar protein sorting-associated protein 39